MKARREAPAPPVALFAALCGLAPLVAMAVVSVARIEDYTLALDLRAWREVAASPVMRGLIGQAVFYGAILACLTPLAAYPIALALAGCVAALTVLAGRARRSARKDLMRARLAGSAARGGQSLPAGSGSEPDAALVRQRGVSRRVRDLDDDRDPGGGGQRAGRAGGGAGASR